MQGWEAQVEGYFNYAVSDLGVVRRIGKDRVVASRLNAQGFLMVTILDDDNEYRTRSVASLVANAFLDPPPNSRYNSLIHLNGDRSDCRAMNLMWRPRWFAIQYHKMFDREPIRVAVYIPYLDKVFHSLREFCTTYGLIEMKTYIALNNGEGCFHYGWLMERYVE